MPDAVQSDASSDSDFSLSDGDDGAFDVEIEEQGTSVEPAWQTTLPGQYSDGRTNVIPYNLPRSKDNKHWQIYASIPILSAVVGTQDGPWFRLLKIRPGKYSDTVHCDLIRRPIFDSPKYQALSYSWGRIVLRGDMYLGESRQAMRVSEHLIQALRRLRQEDQAVFVWADVLCIDQDNFIERAAQIISMAQIYDQAESVRIWLGEDPTISYDHGSDEVLFEDMYKHDNPWWTRMWVIQECAYAKRCPTVMLGPLTMSLQDLVDRWAAVTEQHGSSRLRKGKLDAYHQMALHLTYLRAPLDAWAKQNDSNIVRLPLVVRLRETYWRECSEPHDRVYALLNLIDESEARQLQPDYRKPFKTLWSEALEICRSSSAWQPEQDEYLFSPSILALKDRLAKMDPGFEGTVILAEAYLGNFEILPYLLQRIGTDEYRVQLMKYYTTLQTNGTLGQLTLESDRQSAITLLSMQESLYGTISNQPMPHVLLEIAIKNFLPRTTEALLNASTSTSIYQVPAQDLPSFLLNASTSDGICQVPVGSLSSFLLAAVSTTSSRTDDRVSVVKALLRAYMTVLPKEFHVGFSEACAAAARTDSALISKMLLDAAKGTSHISAYAYGSLEAAAAKDNIPMADHILQWILQELGTLDPSMFVRATHGAIRMGKLSMISWMLTQCENLRIAQDASVRFLEVSFRYKFMPSVELLLDYCQQKSFRRPDDAEDVALSQQQEAMVQGWLLHGAVGHMIIFLKERSDGSHVHGYFWDLLRSTCQLGQWQSADRLLLSFKISEQIGTTVPAQQLPDRSIRKLYTVTG